MKLATTDSLRISGGRFSTHLLPETLTKTNIKETDIKVTIWGTFDISKGEGSGGGYRIRKYYVMKNIYLNPNLNNLFMNV